MGKLASTIEKYVNQSARPTRSVEIIDMSRIDPDLNRKVCAVVRYVDQMEYRADETQMSDPDFRKQFATEAVLAIYDDNLLPFPADKVTERAIGGWKGVLGELALKVLCPKIFEADLGDSGNSPGGERVFEITDNDDLLAITKLMDSAFFTAMYFGAISLREFVVKEVERVKNSSQPTSTSPTQSTPQDSVVEKA
jgi:hypothetical protein